MKSIFASVVLLSAIVLSSCNSHSTSQKETKDSTFTKEIKTKTASEKLLGTWAYLDKSRFELLEVNDSSNVLFYFFIKRDSTPGGNYYYKSAGTIEKWDRYSMSVKTDKYVYYFNIKGDTLFKMYEDGPSEKLVRIYNQISG